MDINKMIQELMQIRDDHGNLPIVGGWIHDDVPPEKLCLIDADGCDAKISGKPVIGVFIE